MRKSASRLGTAGLRATMAATSLVGAFGIVASAPSTAQAAPGSCAAGPRVTDYQGRPFNTRVCPTWTNADVLSNTWQTGEGSVVVGRLNRGSNWVVCQHRSGSNPPLGGASNHWWLYTQADTTRGFPDRQGWGWLPATAVSYGRDEQAIPGVPTCTSYPGYAPR